MELFGPGITSDLNQVRTGHVVRHTETVFYVGIKSVLLCAVSINEWSFNWSAENDRYFNTDNKKLWTRLGYERVAKRESERLRDNCWVWR